MKLYEITKVEMLSKDFDNYRTNWEIESIIIFGKGKGERKTFKVSRHICDDPLHDYLEEKMKVTLFDIYIYDEDHFLQVFIFICILFLILVYIMYLIYNIRK